VLTAYSLEKGFVFGATPDLLIFLSKKRFFQDFLNFLPKGVNLTFLFFNKEN
jgi:hypothetical protein